MITSASNGQIKNIIQLQQKTKARRDRGAFCCRRAENVPGGTGVLD